MEPAMPIGTGRRTCSPLSDEYKLALRLGNACVVTQRISVDDHWRLAWGIARSLWIYYRSAGRRRRMDRLYSRFVGPGDLVFDIGAHAGITFAPSRRSAAASSPSSRNPTSHACFG